MVDIIGMAKELIQKGDALGDSELIAMGMAMLEKYDNNNTVVSDNEGLSKYVCSNCGHEFTYDKPERKKCPKCKKHTLTIVESTPKKNTKSKNVEDFRQQIRQPTQTRIRYNEKGEPDGMYTRNEEVANITNVWKDDQTEGFDYVDKILKQNSRMSPRTRKPVQYIEKTCSVCKSTYKVHPIHVQGRADYVCDKCIRRRSRI